MEFSGGHLVVFTAMIYLIGFLLCFLPTLLASIEAGFSGSGGRWLGATTCFILIAGALNLASWYTSVGSQEDRTLSTREILEEFGFTPGEPYPLVLGDTISGSVGEGSVEGSLFGVSGSMSTRPGSALTVDFVNGDKTYVLEPIMSDITFVQSTGVKPSIEIHLGYIDETLQMPPEWERSDGGGDTVDYTYGECEVRIVDLVVQCIKPVTKTTVTITEDTIRRGPGSLIAEYYHSAIVTLTPEMYEALRGRS